MSKDAYVEVNEQDGIRMLVLSNERQHNALCRPLLDALEQAVTDVYADVASLKGVIVTGAGKKAFAAGADIGEFVNLSPRDAEAMALRGQRLFQRIEDMRVPVVAAVDGYALGGGCELALACHVRFATASSHFGQPEVKLGLIPGYGGTQRLVQLLGKMRAYSWILSADMYTAKEAQRIGLVEEVVEVSADLLPRAQAYIKGIAKIASPEAVAAAIESVNQAARTNGCAYEVERAAFARCFESDNAREGIAAFCEKRSPRFKRGERPQ